jgi:hypothetical protein
MIHIASHFAPRITPSNADLIKSKRQLKKRTYPATHSRVHNRVTN